MLPKFSAEAKPRISAQRFSEAFWYLSTKHPQYPEWPLRGRNGDAPPTASAGNQPASCDESRSHGFVIRFAPTERPSQGLVASGAAIARENFEQ